MIIRICLLRVNRHQNKEKSRYGRRNAHEQQSERAGRLQAVTLSLWEDNMDCPGTYTFYTGESTESTALNPSGKFRFFGLVRQNSDKKGKGPKYQVFQALLVR